MTATEPMTSLVEPYDPTPEVADLAHRLRSLSGDSIRAILLYGSHLLRTNPDRHSAVDFVVIVDDYSAFYGALAGAGELHRPVSLMTGLARVLAPNVLAFAPEDGAGIAKYLLISAADFERMLGPDRPDHFLLARMLQRVGVVWTDTPETYSWLGRRLEEARDGVLDWLMPYVADPVDAEALGRRLLEVCYSAEFRPESAARAGRVFEAQAAHFRTVLQPVLERAARDGTMRKLGERYELSQPVSPSHRRRIRRYFRRSKARTTARWLKHTVTFVNWLPYIERKVERHTGREIRLTTVERKLPIVFLWPRVLYVLLTRPEREIDS